MDVDWFEWFEASSKDCDVESFMEALDEARAPSRAPRKLARLDDDDQLIRAGWRLPELPPGIASRALSKLAGSSIRIRCECDKPLGILAVEKNGYRSVIRPGSAGRQPELCGSPRPIMKWRYTCPIRRCGRQHEVRYDKLTFAFIEAAGAGRSEIRLPLRLPLRPVRPARSA